MQGHYLGGKSLLDVKTVVLTLERDPLARIAIEQSYLDHSTVEEARELQSPRTDLSEEQV